MLGAVITALVAACSAPPAAPTAGVSAPTTPATGASPAAAPPTAASPVAQPGASPSAGAASPVASPQARPAASPAAVAPSPSAVARATPRPAPRPAAAGTFGFGQPATADDIKKIDIDVRPDGAGLPPGSGTAGLGRPIFAQKCATCHGASGEGTTAAPALIGPGPFKPGATPPTIGNYWPYATTVWDYIHRAMPFDKPGSLSPDEVYALTAFLLAENQIIGESDTLDAQSLPRVRMPNATGFTSPDPRPDAP